MKKNYTKHEQPTQVLNLIHLPKRKKNEKVIIKLNIKANTWPQIVQTFDSSNRKQALRWVKRARNEKLQSKMHSCLGTV